MSQFVLLGQNTNFVGLGEESQLPSVVDVSCLIPYQLPEFYREDFPLFVEFIKAYFQWLEVQGEPIYEIKSIPEYVDVDRTKDDLWIYFVNEFMSTFPQALKTHKPTLLKHIKEFYRAKGTERAYELLFRALYNTRVDFYYPSRDILKTDDGKWIENLSVRVAALSGDPRSFVGTKVFGDQSKASGVVEQVLKIQVEDYTVYELFFAKRGITGSFSAGEVLSNTEGIKSRIYNKIVSLSIISGGFGYQDNEIITFSDVSGRSAVAQVVKVDGLGTIKKVQVLSPGAGYSTSATINTIPNGSGATFTIKYGGQFTYPGFYLNEDGFLDSKFLQDDFYYQQFSYVLKLDRSIHEYRETVKRVIHPIGLILFGGVLIDSELDARVKLLEGKSTTDLLITSNLVSAQMNSQTHGIGLQRHLDQIDVNCIQSDDSYKFGPSLRSIDRWKFSFLPSMDFAPDAGVNLLTFPSDFTNAAWTKQNVSVTSSRLTASGAGSQIHSVHQTDTRVVAGEQYHFKVDVKKETHRYVWIGEGADTHYHGGCLDLDTGIFTGNGHIDGYSVHSVDSRFYEVNVFWTRESGSGTQELYVALQSTNSSAQPQSWTAAGTEKVDVRNATFRNIDSFLFANYWQYYANTQLSNLSDIVTDDILNKPWLKTSFLIDPEVSYHNESNLDVFFGNISGITGDLNVSKVANVTSDSDGRVSPFVDDKATIANFTSSGGNKPWLTRADNKENLLVSSEDMSHVSWTVAGGTIQAFLQPNPIDGTTNAQMFVESSATATARKLSFNSQIQFIKSEKYVFSGWIKNNGRDWIRVGFDEDITAESYVDINTNTGEFLVADGVDSGSVEFQELNNGWIFFSIEMTANANNALGDVYLYQSPNQGSFSYDGNGTSGTFIFGFQVRNALADSTYLKTTTKVQMRGISKRRAAVRFLGGQNLNSASALSVPIDADKETVFVAFEISDETVSNGTILADTSNKWSLTVQSGNLVFTVNDGTAKTLSKPIVRNKAYIAAIRIVDGSMILSLNADTEIARAVGNISSLAGTVQFGALGSSNRFWGSIGRAIFSDQKLSYANQSHIFNLLALEYGITEP